MQAMIRASINTQTDPEILYTGSKEINFAEVVCENSFVEFERRGFITSPLSFVHPGGLSGKGGISSNINIRQRSLKCTRAGEGAH